MVKTLKETGLIKRLHLVLAGAGERDYLLR